MKLFNNNKYISIDLGAREIKVIEGKASKKNIIIQNAYTLKIPKNIYFDGMILNMDELSYYLRSSIKDKKLSSNTTIVVLHSSAIITREIVLPKVSDKELKSILSYQVEDYVPIEPEEYLFQFLHLGSIFEDGIEKLNILLIAIPKTIVESHLKLVENIGLKPYVMDFQGNAINKLLNYNDMFNGSNPSKGKTIASIDMGYSSTKINITLDGVLKISRVIEGSISQLIDDIQNMMEIDEEEIIDEIMDLDLSSDENIDSSNFNIVEAFNNTTGTIIEGLDMVNRYYNTRDTGNKVDYILLQGGLSNVKGIEDRFESFFNIDTIRLDSLDKVNSNENLSLYSNAIGGLIRLDEV